jgi:enamine deaminase RidA (YjgF/YER057c/UK114 family)
VKIEKRLKELGLELPETPRPQAVYVPFVRTGNLIFTSGTGCLRQGKFAYHGKVGRELSLEQGREAARITMLNLLSTLRSAVGDLDKIERIVKVTGFVASAPDFGQQPEVMNGASELLEEVFGEKGKHARSAIGVNELPRNIPVEIEMIVEVSD